MMHSLLPHSMLFLSVILYLPDLAAMARFGADISRKRREGVVVALSGGLGAGKTTLARAILAALGHDGEVPSPTFTIVESYASPPLRLLAAHADFYRLESTEEVHELGLDDYSDGGALIAERSEEHTSELQSLMRISYDVFCVQQQK